MARDIPAFLLPAGPAKPERMPTHRQVIAASLAYEHAIGNSELPPLLDRLGAMRAALAAAMREDL